LVLFYNYTMSTFEEVDPNFVRQKLNDPEFQIVDVRTPLEYQRYHIPGSILIPLQYIFDLVDLLDNGKKIIFVCEHGNRSAVACLQLSHLFKAAYNMSGGMQAWLKRGYEVEQGFDEKAYLWIKHLEKRGYVTGS